MDKSIFTDKTFTPDINDLEKALGDTYNLWNEVVAYTHQKYPAAIDEWSYPGEKYGWSFKVKDKKRALVYLLPRDAYFKVAMVFGQKAVDAIMESSISDAIKQELQAAKAYAEGTGIRIEIKDENILKDIFTLIDIKISV
jgi:hypothetical protein